MRLTSHPISCGSELTTPLTRTSFSASLQTLLDLSCSGQLLGHLLPVSVSCTHIFARAHVRTPGMFAVPWTEDLSSSSHRTCKSPCIRRKAMSHRPLAGDDVVVANHGRNTPLGKLYLVELALPCASFSGSTREHPLPRCATQKQLLVAGYILHRAVISALNSTFIYEITTLAITSCNQSLIS